MSTTFFSSDHHFNHTNIIRYCERPFHSTEEMNRVMIERWNAKVKPEDLVFYLGDFAMGPKERWPDFLNSLNGDKVLILGSHDKSAKYQRENMPWKEVVEELTWGTKEYGYWKLVHVPEYKYDEQILSGHVHQYWRRRGLNINVGVDVQGFEPKTIEELLSIPEDPNRDWVDAYAKPKNKHR